MWIEGGAIFAAIAITLALGMLGATLTEQRVEVLDEVTPVFSYYLATPDVNPTKFNLLPPELPQSNTVLQIRELERDYPGRLLDNEAVSDLLHK